MQLPIVGLETHPDGSGSVNAIQNSNWLELNEAANPAAGRTASQSTTSLTASADTFTNDDVGATIRWADGTTDVVFGYVSATQLTMTTSQTKGSQEFEIYRTDQVARDRSIRSLTKQVRTLSTDDRKIPYFDRALGKLRWSPIEIVAANLTTVDATIATLLSVTLDASFAVLITARIVARRISGSLGAAEDSAVYVLRAAVKNVGGTATLIGAVEQDFVREDQAGWDATIDVTGSAFRVRVTGAASNNIDWSASVEMVRVT